MLEIGFRLSRLAFITDLGLVKLLQSESDLALLEHLLLEHLPILDDVVQTPLLIWVERRADELLSVLHLHLMLVSRVGTQFGRPQRLLHLVLGALMIDLVAYVTLNLAIKPADRGLGARVKVRRTTTWADIALAVNLILQVNLLAGRLLG
jgi:hypothetical protein